MTIPAKFARAELVEIISRNFARKVGKMKVELTKIQEMKATVVLKDFAKLQDPNLSSDESIKVIDDLDEKLAKYIPDDEDRNEFLTKSLEKGQEMMNAQKVEGEA